VRVTGKTEEVAVHPFLMQRDDLSKGKPFFPLSLHCTHCHHLIETPELEICENYAGRTYLTLKGD
jgi:hypothetical protein